MLVSWAVHSLQGTGGMNSPGPRRSARFANQQKPNSSSSSGQHQSTTSGSRQPGTGTTPLQRSWLQTFVWVAWAALAVLVAVMAATNPSRAAFVDSISQLTSRGLGQWAGRLLLNPVITTLIGYHGLTAMHLTCHFALLLWFQASYQASLGACPRAELTSKLDWIVLEHATPWFSSMLPPVSMVVHVACPWCCNPCLQDSQAQEMLHARPLTVHATFADVPLAVTDGGFMCTHVLCRT